MTTQIDIMADADLIAALTALNARLTMLDDKMRALHDDSRDAIRQLQERLDVVGSILDSVRADLYIKETEQAYSDAWDEAVKLYGKQTEAAKVVCAEIKNLAIGGDQLPTFKEGPRTKINERPHYFPSVEERNEAALDLIKTAYNDWLNVVHDPFHPHVVRKLVSSIADALAGRPPRD